MGTIGAYGGSRLAALYDDTTDTINKQYASAASLPMWMYSQLSPEELDSELRAQRLAEYTRKYEALAAAEEKEYLERLPELQVRADAAFFLSALLLPSLPCRDGVVILDVWGRGGMGRGTR
jgi:hypothetical protein